MRPLVDTHLLLWAAAKSRRLPKEARRLLENPDHEVFFSAASLWEIVIKTALRKRDFNVDVALLRQRINAAIRNSLDGISLAQLCGQEAVAVWRPNLSGSFRAQASTRSGGRL